jgi:chromosome condensin MukBEF MukE localization factor
VIQEAVERYGADVRSGAFPDERHTYGISAEELAQFESALAGVRDRGATS